MDSAANHPDPAFPRFHARPARGWINGPAGLSYAGGRYHVFFQYNPESARQDNICWGHLSSPDLLGWHEEPVALKPQPGGPDRLGCWTGVVTDDDGVPTAAYSAAHPGAGPGASGASRVVLARGTRDLATWTQDGHIAAEVPPDPQVTAARDPFIFSFQGRRYALQGAGLATGRAAVLLYGADDLRHWKYLGIWFSSDHPLASRHLPANLWECPQLARVPDSSGAESWLLIVSPGLVGTRLGHRDGVGYLLGSLVPGIAGLPVFAPETGGRVDLGSDFYAPQILSLPERTLLWGYSPESAGDEDLPGRAAEQTDDAGWAGILTFPRQLSVHGGALAVEPAAELTAYRGTQRYAAAAGTLTLPRYAEAHVRGGEGRIRLVLSSARHQGTVFTDEVAGGDELRIFVDASIVEAYRHGSAAATVRAYPDPDEVWQLELPHGASADIWELRTPPGTAASHR